MPDLLATVKKNATLDGKLDALPYVWGAEGLVANTKRAKITDYQDLCKPEYKGKTTLRLRRPTLMAFAFALGKNPFSLYGDPKAYAALMDQVGRTLTACKGNLRFFFDNKDQLLNSMRTGEVVAAMSWDSIAWKLNRKTPTSSSSTPSPMPYSGSTPLRYRRAAAMTRRSTPGSTSRCTDVASKIAKSHWQFHGLAGGRCN